MKVPFSWLKEFLKTEASLEDITATLNKIGLEVEAIENPADALANFYVAQIKEAVQHPDADRLRVCQVDVGAGHDDIQIVCGAPNARAGIKVICALPGAVVPANGMVIKKGKIRGVESAGMMCSYRELAQGDEDSGIAELPEDAEIGKLYADWAGLDDAIIEIGITPDRGDALGIRGVARDLAGAEIGILNLLSSDLERLPKLPDESAKKSITLSGMHDSKPYFTGRMIENVANTASPKILAHRLDQMGVKAQSALVDVTNYLLYALNRPLHVFDADKIAGHKLIIDSAKAGEEFKALNGQSYKLHESDMIVRDGDGTIQSLLGIMGGAESAVSFETKNVFVESAYFNPAQIAKTARRLGLGSDSSYRFERGIDLGGIEEGLEIASRLIVSLCGGEIGKVEVAGSLPDFKRTASIDFEKVKTFGNLDVSKTEARQTLEKLGFKQVAEGEFEIPSWRNDILPLNYQAFPAPSLTEEKAKILEEKARKLSGQAQLLNEIVRLRGYEAVQEHELPKEVAQGKDERQKYARDRQLRRFCAAHGLQETTGFSFISEEEQALFGRGKETEKLPNPISQEFGQLRSSLLPNMLKALSRNLAKGLGLHGDAGFFELGPAFGEEGERMMISGIRGGRQARVAGEIVADKKGAEFEWRAAQADFMGLLEEAGVNSDSLSVQAAAPHYYHPGRSGAVYLGRKILLGYFGEIHPKILEFYDINDRVVGFEIALGNVALPKKRKSAFTALNLQPVRRDFAFLAPVTVSGQEIIQSVKKAVRGGKNFAKPADVRIFDIFKDADKLGEGHASIGIEVTFYPEGEALTEDILSDLQEKIKQEVAKAGAELRFA
ncbi:phenylalanine--tRNA ligase subunit beta [Acetobacteraceae bacterium]|nr:phenylalanine--tRNA ligase subunit beta [Acetobacteraceae bacterium]